MFVEKSNIKMYIEDPNLTCLYPEKVKNLKLMDKLVLNDGVEYKVVQVNENEVKLEARIEKIVDISQVEEFMKTNVKSIERFDCFDE